jgi:hypothetical protein
MKTEKQNSAKLKGIMWFIFAGTATLCAFFLPGFVWAIIISTKYSFSNSNNLYVLSPYFLIVYLSALFHSLYRIPVFIFDLGFSRRTVLISKIICTAIFLGLIAFWFWTLFINTD